MPARDIELWLLDRGTWVSADEICRRFDIRPRMLRADGDRDGLLDGFAVSDSAHGFKHVRLLETGEFLRVAHKLTRHAVRELRKARAWRQARQRQRVGLRPHQAEQATGQFLLAV